MADDELGERVDGGESADLPFAREDIETADDDGGAEEAEDEGAIEASDQLGYLFQEVDVLDLLLRRLPRDGYLEEVAEQRLGYVQRQAAEKDGEERDPFEVVPP